ncbi:hypothetical protein T492DRAFT_864073 [Pavlovales sp. CCMP2436]|nr:hypothetical protein T492DRAFT_864073 [Pavlovales sp. CCMP2436]
MGHSITMRSVGSGRSPSGHAVLPAFAALLVLGEVAHVAFRVETPVTRALGLRL